MKKIELFKVESDKITRLRRHCPKCGDGVFLAEHTNRLSCGSCGYTEFKGGGKKIPPKPATEEKTVEQSSKEEEPEEEKPVAEEKLKEPLEMPHSNEEPAEKSKENTPSNEEKQ